MSRLKKVQLRQHKFELLSDPVPINNWSSLSVYQSVRQVFAKPKQVEVCTKFVEVLGFLFFALRQTKLKFGQDFEACVEGVTIQNWFKHISF